MIDLKRFSVFLDGQIAAVFETVPECKKYIDDRWGFYIATIWDNKSRKYILTEIKI